MSTIHPDLSIPELINFIRYSFRESEFDEVQNTLVEREKFMQIKIENLVKDRDSLKKDIDLLATPQSLTISQKCSLDEKLGVSEKRREELYKETGRLKVKIRVLRNEKLDIKKKLKRSHIKCEEIEELLAKMEKENQELRRDKLDANKTTEELKRKLIEIDRIVQELKLKNVEDNHTINELRMKNMEFERSSVSNLDKRNLMKLAKNLSVSVQDLLYVVHDTEDLANAAEEENIVEGLENGWLDADAESGDIGLAKKGSTKGGEVSSSAAGNEVVIISDSDDEIEAGVATVDSSVQTKKRSRTESREDLSANKKASTYTTPEERASDSQPPSPRFNAERHVESADVDDGSCSDSDYDLRFRRSKVKKAAEKGKEKTKSNKRQRSQVTEQTDATKWSLSVEARQWGAENDRHRHFIPERGISVDVSLIARKGWETFISPPKGYDEMLVRDFYASLVHYDTAAQTVPIRGKVVELSVRAINAYYRIPERCDDYPPETFHDMDANEGFGEKIRCITQPGYTFHEAECSIPRSQLTYEARVWMSFIQYNLLPSGKFSRLTKDRALMVYCIIRHHYINVGLVILSELWAARKSKTRSLLYPCLITGLCKAKGVPMIDEWRFSKSKGPITRISRR